MKQYYSYYANAKFQDKTAMKAEKLEAFNVRVKPFDSVTKRPKGVKDFAKLSPCKQRRVLRRHGEKGLSQ